MNTVVHGSVLCPLNVTKSLCNLSRQTAIQQNVSTSVLDVGMLLFGSYTTRRIEQMPNSLIVVSSDFLLNLLWIIYMFLPFPNNHTNSCHRLTNLPICWSQNSCWVGHHLFDSNVYNTFKNSIGYSLLTPKYKKKYIQGH